MLFALHAIDTLLAPTHSTGGGGGKVDPASILYMLATSQLYPTRQLYPDTKPPTYSVPTGT